MSIGYLEPLVFNMFYPGYGSSIFKTIVIVPVLVSVFTRPRILVCVLLVRVLPVFVLPVHVFKCVNGIIDFKFDTKRISVIHSFDTRGKSNFYLLRVRRNFGKQRLLCPGILSRMEQS